MKEIIVIRTSDPDGSIFRSILKALQGKDVQILHAADLEASAPSALTLAIFRYSQSSVGSRRPVWRSA